MRDHTKIRAFELADEVAVLQPPESLRKTESKQVIAELRTFRAKHRLNRLSLREMIKEGRS